MSEEEKPNIVEYEPKYKNLTFSIGEKLHADFRIRLKYEGIGQGKFLRWVILQFVNQTSLLEQLIEEYKKDNGNLSKTREKKLRKEKEKTKKVRQSFSLSEEEIGSSIDWFTLIIAARWITASTPSTIFLSSLEFLISPFMN